MRRRMRKRTRKLCRYLSPFCGPATSARPTSASCIVESSFFYCLARHGWLPDSLVLEEPDTVCERQRQHRLEPEVTLDGLVM